jgi:hypothetical protein
MRSGKEWFSRTIQTTWSYARGGESRQPHGSAAAALVAAADVVGAGLAEPAATATSAAAVATATSAAAVATTMAVRT